MLVQAQIASAATTCIAPVSSRFGWPGVIAHYRARIQIAHSVPPVTLLEGNTPLIPAPRLAAELGGQFELLLKYEGLNPTGSFKDRGMTTAITQAVADGARAVICASTGNTAASAAAYAARAGLKCFVLVPEGKIAVGKLAGALSYGATVISITGSFDDGLRMVREAAERAPIALVNSVNPSRLQGQKTAAFEICDALGASPDWLCLPVGNAGNITSYWLGFSEYFNEGVVKGRPRLLGAQAAGAAPIVAGRVIEHPETLATAIRIGNPARWREAVNALDESGGHICAVTDEEIVHAYRLVSQIEGVFCEPSSAAGLAGLAKGVREGWLDVRGKRIVCVLTGHGLKDPDTAIQGRPTPLTIPPHIEALLELLSD
ncbi:MAG: threonine synthase [Anaerolineae bacterium]|nr:threonine synthase [Thermoflexales bacterium]MDW8406283.1 threonine synthase [Anaerolineae bacterium]